MTEVGDLIFIAVAVALAVLMCYLWVRLIKAREARMLKKEKELRDAINPDKRLN